MEPRIQYAKTADAAQIHLLMNTNYQDQRVVNARNMPQLLGM